MPSSPATVGTKEHSYPTPTSLKNVPSLSRKIPTFASKQKK